jgi:hypothetical protein
MKSPPARVNILCTGRITTDKMLMLAGPLAISSTGTSGVISTSMASANRASGNSSFLRLPASTQVKGCGMRM